MLFAHLACLNTWGYINSYGVFQSYYTTLLSRSASDVAWVGSVQIWLLFSISAFSGRATDAGYFRHIFFIGSVLSLCGVFATSFCTQYWHFFLAQGICQGLGNGLLFVPTLAVLSNYFSSHRVLAMAITASSTATGGLLYPGVVESLLPSIGFAWTLRVIGFIMLALQLVSFAFLRHRIPPRKSGPLIEWAAFRELPYTFFAIGIFLINWGVWFALVYVTSFGASVLRVSTPMSINLLLIMNGVGIPGRIIPAYLADKYFGPMNTLVFASLLGSVVLFCWIAITSLPSLEVFCVLYGVASAGILGLFPATLASLTDDLRKTGTRMGMVFTIISFACLTGPPSMFSSIIYPHARVAPADKRFSRWSVDSNERW